MIPPGSPERKVTRISRRPGWPGAFLKLECGHEQWLAGNETDFELQRTPRPCLSGPCTRFKRAMGNDC